MKRVFALIFLIALVFAGLVLTGTIYRLNPSGENIVGDGRDAPTLKKATYIVEGETVKIQGNIKYFGNEAVGDVNGDGIEDVAFILTDSTDGTGTFYYVAAAIRTATGYIGTNAIYLGDRIAPQSTVVRENIIEANFADRKPEELMSAKPTVGVTVRVKMEKGELVVIDDR